MHDEIRDRVRELLRDKGESDTVGDADPLVTSGLLDSLDVLEIITFLETRFGLDLSDGSFDPGAFDTIAGILAFAEAHAG